MSDFVVILPNIRSLYNVGSIFRTSDALGVSKIYLTGYTGRPDKEPKIAKTSLGAESTVPWEHIYHTHQLLNKLKGEGYTIVALELTPDSLDYRDFEVPAKLALLVGNEVKGLSKNLLKYCDATISLPMLGKKESLNVSVAFGAIGYQLLGQKH